MFRKINMNLRICLLTTFIISPFAHKSSNVSISFFFLLHNLRLIHFCCNDNYPNDEINDVRHIHVYRSFKTFIINNKKFYNISGIQFLSNLQLIYDLGKKKFFREKNPIFLLLFEESQNYKSCVYFYV